MFTASIAVELRASLLCLFRSVG